MDKLISDSAKTEISHKVKDILRAYNISDWQSEPHHQNQNPAEWRKTPIKVWTDTIMNRTGAPAGCWLLTLQYVCYRFNDISTASPGDQVHLQVLYGVTPDISIVLLYTFYQPIFYATHDQHFQSESEESAGYWVGVAENCGDSLTHKVLDAETLRIIHRSILRPRTLQNPNKRPVDDGGEEDYQPHSNPSNIQPHYQMLECQANLIPQLFTSDQDMMMVQPQASLYQNLTQRILLEGLSCYPLETMGETKGKGH